MKSTKIETARQKYIRILRERSDHIDTWEEDAREGSLAGELIEAKYLSGTAIKNSSGEIVAAGVCGITVEGRLFLQKLEEQETADSVVGKSKRAIGFVGGFVLGVVTPLLSDLVQSLVKQ